MLLGLFGWQIEGVLPDLRKCVAIAAPHTSNWDFFFGICAASAMDLRVSWAGKHTLFRWPFGVFMRWLGGIPVTRGSREGVVSQIVRIMERHERFIFGLSPEGTRKRVERWRSGFYHVACQAGVPIVLAYFDSARKVVGVGPVFEPTGDFDTDIGRIQGFYRDKVAKKPAQF